MKATQKEHLRILFFEDNNVLRLLIKSMFEKEGWEVFSFPTPATCPLYGSDPCVCPVTEVCADVIVTDLDMPQVNGFTFVKHLLGKGCKIRHLALLTACEDTATLAPAKAMGFNLFNKGEGIPALMAWLRHLDSQPEKERHLIRWTAA